MLLLAALLLTAAALLGSTLLTRHALSWVHALDQGTQRLLTVLLLGAAALLLGVVLPLVRRRTK